jgi:hypothetical protein
MDTKAQLAQLSEVSSRLLGNIIQLHGQVLALSGASREPTTQDALNELFVQPGADGAVKPLNPGEPVFPGFSFSFEKGAGCEANLVVLPNPAKTETNIIEVELVDPGSSTWFTNEINARWPEVRRARRLDWSVTGSATKELNCRAYLRGVDTEGKYHEFGSKTFQLPEHPAVVQSGFDILIPHTVRFNESAPPKFIVSFELTSFKVTLEYLSLQFS